MRWAKVAFPSGAGEVLFDAGRVTPAQLVAAVEGAGFSAQVVAVKPPFAATGPPRKDCGPGKVFC